jgi:hypothetical protein
MDALIPGFYAWFGSLRIRIGGSEAEETYPGTIHSFAGMALGRVCKVQNLTVGAKHLYLNVWLKPDFCVQMLRLLRSDRFSLFTPASTLQP